MPTSNFQPIRLLDLHCCYKFTYSMANSADSDQLASSEANWSGSTLFANAGYIRVQQDKGEKSSFYKKPPTPIRSKTNIPMAGVITLGNVSISMLQREITFDIIRGAVKEEYLVIILGYFFLFLYKNISLKVTHWGTSNEYQQHMFLLRNEKLSQNCH